MRIFLVALAITFAFITNAYSQIQGFRRDQMPVVCGPTTILKTFLEEKYGETEIVIIGVSETDGRQPDGTRAAVVYRNPEKQTFTLVLALSSGISCVITGGIQSIGDVPGFTPKKTQ